MDVYPVVLAGGQGTGLYPLNEAFPKALLPIGNHPLIYYPLRLLENNKFQEVTIITNARDMKVVTLALDGYHHLCPGSTMKLIPFEVSDATDMGSASALINLKAAGRVKSDLLVLSCDVIATISLHHLWERHVVLESAVSILLAKPLPSISEENKKAANNEQDLIGLTEGGQVVFHSSLADVDDELKLSKRMLLKTPHFKMYSNLLDSHVYIISKWVIDYMAENLKGCLSFKREVLPYLIKNQDSKDLKQLAISSKDSIHLLAHSYSSYPVGTTPNTHSVQCHAHIINGELCMRVNTVPLYMEANRIIFQHFPSLLSDKRAESPSAGLSHTRSSTDSVIGDGTQLLERSSVKRSMIGRHCMVREKVKIINSVVMDHVMIGEGCVVQNTILCSRVRLEDKVTLRDCTVGPSVTINSKAEHKGELLVEESELEY